MSSISPKLLGCIAVAALILAAGCTPPAPAAVYTTTNDPAGNAVMAYSRAADGSLTLLGSYPTEGKGTGASLGDQGALSFDANQNLFFAVNAGDDSLSMLSLKSDGTLSVLSHVSSNGAVPVSVTVSGSLVYVVNAGNATVAANIAGFQIKNNTLTPIDGSTQALSASNPAPAQIQFAPGGKLLVVVEKGTSKIDTFVVGTTGVASAAKVQASAGMTPFGFAFSAKGNLLVTEAVQSTVSSYAIAADGTLATVTGSAATQQGASCWMVSAGDFAYAANARTNNLTGFKVAADGALTPLNADGVTGQTGDGPVDEAATPDSRFVYVLNGRGHSFSFFKINTDGSLTKQPDFTGLPTTAVGLVAR